MPRPTALTSLARRAVQVAVVGLCLGVVGWTLARQWSAVAGVIGELSAPALLGSALAAMAAAGCGWLSWRAILSDLGSEVAWRGSMRVFFVGQLGKYLPGKVWQVLAQMRLGREYQVPGRTSAAAAVIVMVLTLGTGALVTAVCLPVLGNGAFARYWWALLALPLAALVLWPPVLNRLLAWLMRLARREPMPAPLSLSGIARSVGWSVLTWLLFGVHLWALLADLGADADALLARSIGAFAASWTIGFLLAIAPAGLGPREIALVVVLGTSVAQPVALVAALVSRLLITVADIAWPALALAAQRRQRAVATSVTEPAP
ncbi:MAG TPA: lysylphosphatidylglycerol synthase domain-containing protein [Micromonosporaceae bacterium]